MLVANTIRARLTNAGLDYLQYFNGSHRLAPVFEIKEGELGAYYIVVTSLE